MATEGNPEVGSDVKSDARNALGQEADPRSARRRRSTEDVLSERTTSTPSTPSTPSTSAAPVRESTETESVPSESASTSRSRTSKKKPQEYVAQYSITVMRGVDPAVAGSGHFVTLKPGDPITVEDADDQDGIARLMQSGFVVTSAVWDAKQMAREAEAEAREAQAQADREQAGSLAEAAID